LFLSIWHPSRRREQANAVTEGYCLQAKACRGAEIKM
jgi:hypothetical protein